MPRLENLPPAPQLEITLTDVAHGGAAIGRINGEVIFVDGGLPGEEVLIERSVQKRTFGRGRLLAVRKPSPYRVEPPCPLFGTCGGCQWQHVAYEEQLRLKRRIVEEQMARIGGFIDAPVAPTVPSPHQWEYRNHARFSVGYYGDLCFTRPHSHSLLPIPYCHLMHPAINAILASVQGKCRGLRQVAVRYAVGSGQSLVDPPLIVTDLGIKVIRHAPDDAPRIQEELLGHRFQVYASSFFQVNTRRAITDIRPWLKAVPAYPMPAEYGQAEVLAMVVIDRLRPEPDDVVVDAYCGVGTFALLIADKVRRVIGIEEAHAAVKNAEANATGVDNVLFLLGKTERVLPQLTEKIDAVILDPARAGVDPLVIEALLRLRPARLVYVSCDPATLARDLKLLCAGGYTLHEVQPIDMFPQTYHIENVATLGLRD
jgi:23S rRNA (uracil1939-C5)-methyltransferase